MQRDGLALQLAIPSRVDLLLPSSEHVLDAMRTVGTIQTDVVVTPNVAFLQSRLSLA